MSLPEDKPSAVVEVVEGVLVSGAAVSALLGVLDVEGFAGDGFRVVDDEGDVVDEVDGVVLGGVDDDVFVELKEMFQN